MIDDYEPPPLPANTTWRDFAECLHLDHNMFFPKRGESTKAAKAICGSCYVAEQCLEDAIERREIAGIRGGKSTRERQAIIKERKLVIALTDYHTGLV